MLDRPDSPTAASRKRSPDLFDSLTKIVTRNVNSKPALLPKRQPSEAELMAHYNASRVVPQQPAKRSSAAFHYTPHKKTYPTASIFSPATSRAYASPVNGSVAPGASPGIQPGALPIQQQGMLGRSPTQSITQTPMRSR